jgi:hypothetical protein
MTTAEAKELLQFHSFTHPDVDHSKMEGGFLGSLRPYQGQLFEKNFHEVMAALRVLAPSLQQTPIDREVVSALWNICHLGRAWGVYPNGMLRSNNLIQPQEIERLESWVACISYATMMILDGVDIDDAFSEYDKTKT